jgi:hypothetical protein
MPQKLHIGSMSEEMSYEGQIVPVSDTLYYNFQYKAKESIPDDPKSPLIEDRDADRFIYIIFPDGGEKEIKIGETDVFSIYDSKSKTSDPVLRTWSLRDVEDFILGKSVQVKKPGFAPTQPASPPAEAAVVPEQSSKAGENF